MTAYPHQPSYKARDTARAAAHAMREKDPPLRDQVLSLLKLGDANADEIANLLGQNPLSIRPRCSQLAALGLIEDSHVRRPSSLGSPAIVWTVVK